MQQLSFNGSLNNCNFCFRKKKILLDIDNKTKTLSRRINFGCKVYDVANLRDLHMNIVFTLIDWAANVAIMARLLGEPNC